MGMADDPERRGGMADDQALINALVGYPQARQPDEGWGAFLRRQAPEALSTVLLGLNALRPSAGAPLGGGVTLGDWLKAAQIERGLPTRTEWDIKYNRLGEAVRNDSGGFMHPYQVPVDPGVRYGLPVKQRHAFGTPSASEAAGSVKGINSAANPMPARSAAMDWPPANATEEMLYNRALFDQEAARRLNLIRGDLQKPEPK